MNTPIEIYYEVIGGDQANPLINYLSGRGNRGGCGIAKTVLIQNASSWPETMNQSIELIQVENLTPVRIQIMNRLNGNKLGLLSSTNQDFSKVLTLHREVGIPLHLTVDLLLKVLGLNTGELQLGIEHPSGEFKAALAGVLGVDPWQLDPEVKPVIVSKELT